MPKLAGWSISFLIFGLFWWRTAHRGWFALLPARPRRLWRNLAAGILLCTAILCLAVTLTLVRFGLGSSLYSGDCRSSPLALHQRSSQDAVFTARIVFVGRSIEAMTRAVGVFRNPEFGLANNLRVGDWAIGVARRTSGDCPRAAPPRAAHKLRLLEGRNLFHRWDSIRSVVPHTAPGREVRKLGAAVRGLWPMRWSICDCFTNRRRRARD